MGSTGKQKFRNLQAIHVCFDTAKHDDPLGVKERYSDDSSTLYNTGFVMLLYDGIKLENTYYQGKG